MKAIAVCILSNTLALEIVDIVYGIEDVVCYRFSDEEIIREKELQFDSEGKPFFYHAGTEYYISEFIRV